MMSLYDGRKAVPHLRVLYPGGGASSIVLKHVKSASCSTASVLRWWSARSTVPSQPTRGNTMNTTTPWLGLPLADGPRGHRRLREGGRTVKMTAKKFGELAVGDVIVDLQGARHAVTEIGDWETVDGIWNDAKGDFCDSERGRRLYTDTYPRGGIVDGQAYTQTDMDAVTFTVLDRQEENHGART